MDFIYLTLDEAQNNLRSRPLSDAELHLSVGIALQACLRHGMSLPSIARKAQASLEECELSLKYAESSNEFKFQALVESWPWSRITAALAASPEKQTQETLAKFNASGPFPNAA